MALNNQATKQNERRCQPRNNSKNHPFQEESEIIPRRIIPSPPATETATECGQEPSPRMESVIASKAPPCAPSLEPFRSRSPICPPAPLLSPVVEPSAEIPPLHDATDQTPAVDFDAYMLEMMLLVLQADKSGTLTLKGLSRD